MTLRNLINQTDGCRPYVGKIYVEKKRTQSKLKESTVLIMSSICTSKEKKEKKCIGGQ
jgi:hypothetical protein